MPALEITAAEIAPPLRLRTAPKAPVVVIGSVCTPLSDPRFPVTGAPGFIDRVRFLAKTHSDRDIARLLGCSRTAVGEARRREGIPPCHQSKRLGRPVVPAPPWCPSEFVEGFHKRVNIYGQFHAAAWVRRQMRKAGK